MTEKEFAEIIETTKGIVLSAIEKYLAERFYHAIDDVAQETYVRAYRSLIKNKFRGDSSISTWLYTIAKNESLRMNKTLQKEEMKFQKSLESFEPYQDDINSDESSLVEELMNKIELLPIKYREVMKLASRGFTINQISEKLNLNPGTVKSRSSRGRDMLYKIFKGEDYERL